MRAAEQSRVAWALPEHIFAQRSSRPFLPEEDNMMVYFSSPPETAAALECLPCIWTLLPLMTTGEGFS